MSIKSPSTVWNVIDDTDSRIEYFGEWNLTAWDILDDKARPRFGLNNTLHATSTNGSFTINFNGTSFVLVYGSVLSNNVNTSCSMAEINSQSPTILGSSSGLELDLFACDSYEFGDELLDTPGEKTLVFNITTNNTDDKQPVFYLDYFVYEPSHTPVDGDILQIGNAAFFPDGVQVGDSNFELSPGWAIQSDFDALVWTTSVAGSNATIKFNGTKVELYGTPIQPTNTTYQLDDGGMLPFPTKDGLQEIPEQLMLNLSSLSPSEHTLMIENHDNLEINFFLVRSLTKDQQDSLASQLASPAPSLNPPGPNSTSKGGLIGGIVGGVVVLALLCCIGCLWIRRRRRRLFSALEPTSFIMSEAGPDFDPYTGAAHTRLLRKTERNIHENGSSSRDINQTREGDSRLRLGYLKLQQRLEVLLNRPLEVVHVEREAESGPSVPRVHTDSGWRMRGSAEMDEVPPNYSES